MSNDDPDTTRLDADGADIDWRGTAQNLQAEVDELHRQLVATTVPGSSPSDPGPEVTGVLVVTFGDGLRLYREGATFDNDHEGYLRIQDRNGAEVALFPSGTWTCAEFTYAPAETEAAA